MDKNVENKRRPIKSRDHKAAKSITAFLIKINASPNGISVFSIIFALLGMASLIRMRNDITILNTVLAIIGIQGRLLCNLFDGMVAIDGGKTSLVGEIYNELPDRISDTILILPLGYIVIAYPYALELAWGGAFFSLFTAYIRNFGTSLGITTFKGIMAKQKRMALITVALIFCICFRYTNIEILYYKNIIYVMLIILNVGSVITIITRLSIIVKYLKSREIINK